jgi:hypothetical protein
LTSNNNTSSNEGGSLKTGIRDNIVWKNNKVWDKIINYRIKDEVL